jgi:hypothetical protein
MTLTRISPSKGTGQTLGVQAQAGSRQPARCEDVDCAAFRNGFMRTVATAGEDHTWLRLHRRSRTVPDGMIFREQSNRDETTTIIFEPGQQCLHSIAGDHGWIHTKPGLLTLGTPINTHGFTRRGPVPDAQPLGTTEDIPAQREWLDRLHDGTDAIAERRQRG